MNFPCQFTFKVNFECRTATTSNAEGTRFATMPQIGMSGMPQVRVGVRRSCYVINRQSHAFSCNSRIIVHVTVKLHSNVCDYLYKLCLQNINFFAHYRKSCFADPVSNFDVAFYFLVRNNGVDMKRMRDSSVSTE